MYRSWTSTSVKVDDGHDVIHAHVENVQEHRHSWNQYFIINTKKESSEK